MRQLLNHLVPTPFGQRPGEVLAGMRTSEMVLHAWDLARATGQPTDLDLEIAEQCPAEFRVVRDAGLGGDMFAPIQQAPDDASAADRLTAYAGRTVTA